MALRPSKICHRRACLHKCCDLNPRREPTAVHDEESTKHNKSSIINPYWSTLTISFLLTKKLIEETPSNLQHVDPCIFSTFQHVPSFATSKCQAYPPRRPNEMRAGSPVRTRWWLLADVGCGSMCLSWTSYENLVNLMIFYLSIWQLNPWTDFRVHVRNAICQYVLSSICRRLYRHIESIE